MADRPQLAALADRVGIMPDYINHNGTERRCTSNETRLALLAAMGIDASSEDAAEAALDSIERTQQSRIIDPVRVVQDTAGETGMVTLRPPQRGTTSWDWVLELRAESGCVQRAEGRAAPHSGGESMRVPLPMRPGLGYHHIRVVLRGSHDECEGEQSLIVTPSSCITAAEVLGDRRAFGLWTNLYSIRSRSNWGVGNFGDLRDLVSWAKEVGAGYVGINPLHSIRNHGTDISPYRPLSRLYRNTIYLDASAIPELDHCVEAGRILASPEFADRLDALRRGKRIDYEGIAEIQRDVLKPLHRVFMERHRGKRTARGESYAAYRGAEGQTLTDFATFQALDDFFRTAHPPLECPRHWPVESRNPRSTAVEAFRRDHADEVDFHCYLQFEVDRQLGDVAQHAQSLGLPVGLYQDLAIGTSPDGCDPWSFPDLFIDGASLGAPPDDLGPQGQDWGLPPVNPLRLSESGYLYWVRLLRKAFAHAGAVRIDHIMGLHRQFWVPRGCSGSAGAYVRYPADDLFAVLALESRRHGALVIGENLGTVPPGFAETLERWGVLSTHVLYFERDPHGEFRPPAQYSRRAMATVNSHDLAPLEGYWKGADLGLRRRVGQFANDEQLAAAQAYRSRERDALTRALHREGLALNSASADPAQRCAAVHAFIARTPAPLIGVSLDDLAGETEPINLPGVDPIDYPCWSRRMSVSLEDLRFLPAATQTVSAIQGERGSRPACASVGGDS